MRETADIPRDELFEFKRRNNLTADKMAVHFGVNKQTMGGWLYRQRARKMSQTSYDMVMQKLVENYIPIPRSRSARQPLEDTMLPLIATAIKGDAESCWLHYVSEVYPCDPKEEKIVIGYTCIHESTLKRWLELIMPDGQNLLRLRCFLAHRGYGVTELEALRDVFRSLSYLIADQKMTIREVVNKLGYHKDGALLQILLGRVTGISEERLERCRELIAQQHSLARAKQEIPACTDHTHAKQVENIPIVCAAESDHKNERPPAAQHVNGARRWEVDNLAALVRIMLPLAEDVLSDAYTEKDREHLRTLANGNEVFRLSNVLNGLCGPRVRVRMMNKQEGE